MLSESKAKGAMFTAVMPIESKYHVTAADLATEAAEIDAARRETFKTFEKDFGLFSRPSTPAKHKSRPLAGAARVT